MPDRADYSPSHSDKKKLCLAFVTEENSNNPEAWSGSIYQMLAALRRADFEVTIFDRLRPPTLIRLKTGLWKLYFNKIKKQNYQRVRHPDHAKGIALSLLKKLDATHFDVVLAPSSVAVSALKCGVPIIFWTDATLAGMQGFYSEFSNLSIKSKREGYAQEQMALDNCTYAIYTSDWARDSALKFYRAAPEKVKTIRFGANIPELPAREEVEKMILERTSCQKLRFLLIGVDWKRKGGQKALEVVQYLRQCGHEAELHVVGTSVPAGSPSWVIEHGFVKKYTQDGWKKFYGLMAQSHFHILPSEAECCAVALNEAAAFGLPSLASNVGGISSAVLGGRNGFVFPLEAPASEYFAAIAPIIRDAVAYERLCWSSYETYHTLLSWDRAAEQLAALVGRI